MSCFIVPNFHIDALVSWAIANHASAFVDGLTPRELAGALHRANCAAYRARYGEEGGEEYRYTSRPEVHAMPAVQVLKAVACLDYQCSDWPDYPGSLAQRALSRITDTAVGLIPGYQSAAWTLEEVTA